MMMPAEQRGVFGARFSAVGPVVDGMVDLAPLGRLIATGVHAVLIAGDHCGSHMGGDGSLAAPDIQDLAVWSENNPTDVAIAGHFFQQPTRNRATTVGIMSELEVWAG